MQTCPICGWIDDEAQLQFAAFAGGPNGVSLLEAQRNFADIGAKNEQSLSSARFPSTDDVRDQEWRPLDDDRDELLSVPNDFDGLTPPRDTTQLYYWKAR